MAQQQQNSGNKQDRTQASKPMADQKSSGTQKPNAQQNSQKEFSKEKEFSKKSSDGNQMDRDSDRDTEGLPPDLQMGDSKRPQDDRQNRPNK